jgi:hypothetical protein
MEKTYRGSCHCGAVRFECRVDLDQSSKCNCSVCAKGRFWKAIAKADAFTLLQGKDALADYQFGSRTIHHQFCRSCGIKPFGRGHLEQLGGTFYAVNVACLDDVPDAELAAAKVRFENGRDNRWESAPGETRHL